MKKKLAVICLFYFSVSMTFILALLPSRQISNPCIRKSFTFTKLTMLDRIAIDTWLQHMDTMIRMKCFEYGLNCEPQDMHRFCVFFRVVLFFNLESFSKLNNVLMFFLLRKLTNEKFGYLKEKTNEMKLNEKKS